MIYVTPFRASDLQATGSSTDSGFESLEAVLAAMGPEHQPRNSTRTVIYGDGEDRVIFSNFIFCIDAPVIMG